MRNFLQLVTITSFLIALNFLFTPAANAKSFPDVDPTSPVGIAVSKLVKLNIVGGNPDGTYKPNDPITRAEAAKIMYGILELEGFSNEGTPAIYTDVKENHWAYKYVMTISDWKIMNGYSNGKFGPGDNLTRGQTAKILKLALNLPSGPTSLHFSDVVKSDYFFDGVASLFQAKITTGTSATTFSPNKNVTRAELALFLDRSGVLNELISQNFGQVLSAIDTIDGQSISEAAFNNTLVTIKNDLWGILPTNGNTEAYFDEATQNFQNLAPGEAIFDIYFNDYNEPIYLKVLTATDGTSKYQFLSSSIMQEKADKMTGTLQLSQMLQKLANENKLTDASLLEYSVHLDDRDKAAYAAYLGSYNYYFEFFDAQPIVINYDFPLGASGVIQLTPYTTQSGYDYRVTLLN